MGGQPSPIEPEQEPAPEFAVPNFIQERFCISDDTCVDYSGTDYICVAGKCVPMGGQPSPIEPEVKQLDKPGGETRDTYNTPVSGNSPELEQERFCISDDTCVDYSGTDYICVAGKCVPMGGQPSPIEP